ncbi:hypothetical protein [Parageobacillus toebii]|uniref:hypothetical protein n=1 Tax=Parageobacillus toebii TaxID=153151 RepID=UPI001967E9D0|nr:hypothetical protein [Parageobacillus toebii]QSB48804.1 hypothetical protein JTI59_17365 [Parageobacillus toebii]
MLQRSYYFVEFETFEIPDEGFITYQQQTLEGTGINAEPVSSLKMVEANYYKGWSRLIGTHERYDRTPRRMAGNPEYFSESITGGDKPFDVFYNPQTKRMILKTSKTNVKGLLRRMIKNYPSFFVPKEGQVDFAYLLDRLQNTTVIASWFNDLKGQVTSVGLFGDRVNLDDKFNYYKAIGSMSALTVELTIKGQNQPCTIMITKERGVVIYENWDQKQDLDFLFNIQHLLFYKNNRQ